jgi:hypothetical protein
MTHFRPGDFSPRAYFFEVRALARPHNWRIVGGHGGAAGWGPLPVGRDVRPDTHLFARAAPVRGRAGRGFLSMKRIRLGAVVTALLPAVLAGCSNFGQGPIMSRLHGRQEECACEAGGGPCCDGPPLGEGGVAVGPTLVPGGQPAVPPLTPLAPAPRILVDPAQPTPALPSSRTRQQ